MMHGGATIRKEFIAAKGGLGSASLSIERRRAK
jgi:hypothetical protein